MRRPIVLAAMVLVACSTLVSCSSGPPAAPTSSVKSPFVGQKFTLSGDIGSDGPRPVELQLFEKETWKKFASGTTKSDGTYAFTASGKGDEVTFRVLAPAQKDSETLFSDPVTIAIHKDKISLGVYRIGDSGRASGKASPVIPGRKFALQVQKGTDWTQVGKKVEETEKGIVSASFDLKGTKTYRFVGDPVKGSEGATSTLGRFVPGPKALGKNVVYVSTDNRKDPMFKDKGLEGKALFVSGSNATRPLDLEEVAVRGNSTIDKPKKPYKLKFDKKQSPFGFPKDKTFLLIANYGDHTLVRSSIGWETSAGLDGIDWTPRNVFTELFLNGKYQGSYQLVESIKIADERVAIDEEIGVIIEMDPHFYEDGVPGFKGDHKIPYAFKDPDERKTKKDGSESLEGITDDKVSGMKQRILDFEKVLYGPDFKDPKKGWRSLLDVDAAVDYYLVKEFVKENDGDGYRSNYFYMPDYSSPKAKFFMGPLWDFDRSAGAKPPRAKSGTTIALPTGWWLRGQGSPNHKTTKTHWFAQLSKDPSFLDAVKARWLEKRDFFKDVADNGADRGVAALGPAAANDRAIWGGMTDRYEPYSDTYEGEIAYLKDWYKKRFAWIDKELS